MAKIFVSYSRADEKFTERFVARLNSIYPQHDVFYDQQVPGGHRWWQYILDEIADSDLFIYLMSNDSLESSACRAEFTEAVRLQKHILPVIVRPRTRIEKAGDTAEAIREINWIDLSGGFEDDRNANRLYASISHLLQESTNSTSAARPAAGSTAFNMNDVSGEIINVGGVIHDNRTFITNPTQKTEMPPEAPKAGGNDVRIIVAIIGAVATIGAAIIGLVGSGVFDRTPDPTTAAIAGTTPPPSATNLPGMSEEDARATGAAQAYATLTALAPTNTPTITLTPTETPISSSDIQRTAQAEIFATETSAAGTQAVIAQQTQNAVQTEQFIAGATATYIAVLSLTPRATNTPPPTNTPIPPTATNTPTNTPPPTATPDRFTEIITLASNFSGTNTDWTPQVWTFADDPAGAEMVVVPVGSFEMGSTKEEIDAAFTLCNEIDRDTNCERSWFDDEGPSHTQTFSEPFWIDRYEVTNAQFAAFLNARGNESGDGFERLDDDDSDVQIVLNGDTWQAANSSSELPVIEVTWFGARDYCAWRADETGENYRLPTEAEWEYVARGPNRSIYPWGNNFSGNEANHCDQNCAEADFASNFRWTQPENNDGFVRTAPVTEFNAGQSWVGAYNMAGNVWEWTSSLYGDYPYESHHESNGNTSSARVLRGGGFLNTSNYLRSAYRGDWYPDDSDFVDGFRCARS